MNADLCRPTDDYYARLRDLFAADRCKAIADLVDGIPVDSPYGTIARAFDIVSTARRGHRRLAELVDYRRDVMIFDTRQGVLAACHEQLEEEAATIARCMPLIEPDSRMPYINGRKTRDIFEQTELPTEALFEVFTTCFGAFVQRQGMDHLLRGRDNAYLQGWRNVVEPNGSLGAHFHPGAWISLTYYPPRAGLGDHDNSAITFGRYPPEMGGGAGIEPISVPALPGRVVVFPASLGHAVDRQNPRTTRVSFAADIRLAFTDEDLEAQASWRQAAAIAELGGADVV